MKKKLPILLLLLITSSYSQTYVPTGSVSGTWSSQNSPYHIQGDINIPNDSTLTIEPGVDVIFDGHYGLFVQGRLLAIGTSSDRISFTVSDTTGFYDSDTTSGGWDGIHFIDTPLDNDTSKIIFCSIQYGKAIGVGQPDNAGGAFFISNFDKLIISNCQIHNNSAGGLNSPSGGGLCLYNANIILVENEIFHNHALDGGGIQIWESDPVFINNKIKFNVADQAGGAVWIGGASNVEFNSDSITNNTAEVDGGGIICWQTTNTTFSSVNIVDNVAYNGGGATFIECEAKFSQCNISDNSAEGSGGGINANTCAIEINNSSFEKDTSSLFGGAIVTYNSSLNIKDCNLIDNGTVIRGGAIHSTFSNLNISNSTFKRDTANIFGGAIAIENTELSLNNCNFEENNAGILGGAIHSDFSDVKLSNCIFDSDSSGDSGGGIFTWQSKLNIDECNFTLNNSLYRGGAISIDSTKLQITNSSFTSGKAMWGGAIAAYRSDALINNNDFSNNSSEHGGAINCEYSSLQLNQNSLNQNSSIWGGGISATNCGLVLDSCSFSDNSAENQGGSLEYIVDTTGFISKLKLQIDNSTFQENSSNVRCGAIIIEQYNSLNSLVSVSLNNSEFKNNHALRIGALRIGNISDFTISNSKFIDNTVTQHTAACTFTANSSGLVSNCLFAKNIANGGTSGGVGVSVFSDVNFMNCTFVNNRAGSGGGIQLRQGGIAKATNSVFWGNYPDQISLLAVNDTSSCKVYLNFNDILFGKDSINVNDTISVVEWGIGNIDSDPLFVDTLSNDFHLQSVSPCLAAGIDSIQVAGIWQRAPLSDIEGNARPFPVDTKPDLGVYESQYPVSVKDVKTNLPNEFVLYQNYPNPFNSSSEIKYSIPKSSKVVLKIFNVLGNEITTLVKEEKSVGTYKIKWLADDVPSGVYFYQLKAGDYSETKKMILLK
jgi:predicted outer membrane repeat protein